MVCLGDAGLQRLLPSLPKITGDYELAESYFDLLPNLKVLSLGLWGRRSALPDSLCKLKRLQVLHLSCYNQVKHLPNNLVSVRLSIYTLVDIGDSCAALQQLPKLECLHLYLQENSHIDLSFLESTSKLRELQIAGGPSSWASTTRAASCFHIKNLFHLKELRLFCKADLLPVDTFQSLTKLEHFHVSEVESVVDWDCQTLKNVKLGSTSDICPRILGKCMLDSFSCSALSLKELLLPSHMEFCKVPPLDSFRSLKKLQVSLAVRCLPQTFGSCQAFPLLQELSLNGCGLLAEIHALDKLPQLRYLELSGCAFERLSKSFGQFPTLERMEIKDCKALVELRPLDKLQEDLRRLTLEGLSSLVGLPALDRLQNLETLTLQRLSSLEHLPALDRLRKLQFLTLKALPCLPDTFGCLYRLTLEECPGTLRDLEIRRCGMKYFPQSLTGLTSLIICDCDELEMLPPTFANLEELSFAGCNLFLSTLPVYPNSEYLM